MKVKSKIIIQHCSTIDYDCPFFKCYERGTCYDCSCALENPPKELDHICIDSYDQKPANRPEWCKLNVEDVIISGSNTYFI